MIVIISCGQKKCVSRTTAEKMYVGSYFKAQLNWARKLTTDDKIYILSAKYGFLKLNDKIDPYDIKFGNIGTIDYSILKKQSLHIENNTILSSAGSEYKTILIKLFPHILFPIKGKGMGYKIKEMIEWKKN